VSRIFLAGAAGAIGRRLTPLLCAAGHSVWGTTRSPDRIEFVRGLGACPIMADVFDAEALAKAVLEAKPEIVIHQLTDLAILHDPAKRPEALARNARLRDEGTRNLVAAARQAGARRLIAQSIAWVYASGPRPYREDNPLDINADGPQGVSVRGVASLERQVLDATPVEGVVLRYGRLYGPETGADAPRPAPRSMSTRRPTPLCWRSTMASRVCSTSPTPATRSRPKRRQPNSAGAPSSGSRRSEQPLGSPTVIPRERDAHRLASTAYRMPSFAGVTGGRQPLKAEPRLALDQRVPFGRPTTRTEPGLGGRREIPPLRFSTLKASTALESIVFPFRSPLFLCRANT
jgi:dTDP-4-dehydrorhamnose reductase